MSNFKIFDDFLMFPCVYQKIAVTLHRIFHQNLTTMQAQSEHITPLPANGSGMSEVIGGFSQTMNGIYKQYAALEAENRELRTQLRALQQEQPNIVAQNKQNEWIAVLYVLCEKGFVTGCTKKEFMQRMAKALGCPGIADYNRHLYIFKGTEKFGNILDEIKEIIQEVNNDNKNN